MRHTEEHPLAGKTVTLKPKSAPFQLIEEGAKFRIEDWQDRVMGASWMHSEGNPAALGYAMRSAGLLPLDDEVVYGKIGSLGYIVHVTELGEEIHAE